jgi:hypothetical protein
LRRRGALAAYGLFASKHRAHFERDDEASDGSEGKDGSAGTHGRER